MTGQRPSPRGRGDPWRGGRPRSDDAGPGVGSGAGHDAELEDLPPALVIRTGRRRVGVPTALAALALVGLLGAGFGVLGGRPNASPSTSASGNVAFESGAAPTPALAGPTPKVTPAVPCGPDPKEAPRVYLEVNGVSSAGEIDFEGPQPLATPGGVVIIDDEPGPVLIPTGATTDLWIANAACAAAWSIGLVVGDGAHLPVAVQANPDLDPALASQNRFRLAFDEVRTIPGEQRLEADLFFPGGRHVLAGWQIRFLPIVRPRAWLNVVEARASIELVEGCDVVLTLRNGDEGRPGCDRDLSSLPGPPAKVEPGAQLELVIEGWSVTDAVVNCGSQSDRVFSPAPTASCIGPLDGTSFAAPHAGDWTLAVAACAVGYTQFAANRICGTWYAAIDTR